MIALAEGNLPSPTSASKWSTIVLCVATALLAFAPLAILAPAIGWPASLGEPAAHQLKAISAAASAVQNGYGVYLLYSILILPVMAVVSHRVFGTLNSALAITVIAFAALSALARSIGILRWLTVMPELAISYQAGDAGQRAVIEPIFEAIHAYGGGIGEILGVGLFMALSLSVAMIAALKNRSLPIWLSGLGLVSSLLLFSLVLPPLGVQAAAPMAIAVSTLSFWMLLFGSCIAFAKNNR
jgi:Domain of unknown function (DUF4386)